MRSHEKIILRLPLYYMVGILYKIIILSRVAKVCIQKSGTIYLRDMYFYKHVFTRKQKFRAPIVEIVFHIIIII